MAATTRGTAPLKFGVTVFTGYIVESSTRNATTENLVIDDEAGDQTTSITGFGLKNEITLEVIPKSGTSIPTVGSVLTYDSVEYEILTLDRKQVRKDVEKWSIKAQSFPTIDLSP